MKSKFHELYMRKFAVMRFNYPRIKVDQDLYGEQIEIYINPDSIVRLE